MAKQSEGRIVDAIIKFLRTLPRSFVYKVHGGRFQRAGLPDIYFTCDRLDGQSFWFEVKTSTGRLTRLQEQTIEDLDRAGCVVAVVRSVDDVRVAIANATGWGGRFDHQR